MRVASWGHVVFAATMIAVGIMGLVTGEFAPIWLPVPKSLNAQHAIAYVCAFVALASGVGMLWQRSAAVASRVLFFVLLAWLLLVDGYQFIRQPGIPLAYAACQTAVLVAAAWVLFVWFAGGRDPGPRVFAASDAGLGAARVLYGLPLILFGIAHFTYIARTTSMVPGWLPWHLAWAYFFGCTFIAAGLAVIIGVYARLAAVLSVVQVGMFTVLVWGPILAARPSAADWSESVVSWALFAAGWVVADSYRGSPLFAASGRKRAT